MRSGPSTLAVAHQGIRSVKSAALFFLLGVLFNAPGALAADSGRPHFALEEDCLVLEINHTALESGGVFHQIIFWDVAAVGCVVRDWRSLRDEEPSSLPYRLSSGRFRYCFRDRRDGGVLRSVTARSVIETWTASDPEVANKAIWPPEMRRGLIPAREGRRP